MAYASWSVVFGEQPSAAKWNILGTNDASFNDGTGLGTNVINDSSLKYGKVRTRQGGSATNWQTSGTTTYDYKGTNTFIQCGTLAITSNPIAVTFPTAFNQVPIVVASSITAASFNVFIRIASTTSTGCTLSAYDGTGTARTTETANWIAIGE